MKVLVSTASFITSSRNVIAVLSILPFGGNVHRKIEVLGVLHEKKACSFRFWRWKFLAEYAKIIITIIGTQRLVK
jgi:hypothetical protein